MDITVMEDMDTMVMGDSREDTEDTEASLTDGEEATSISR